MLHYEHLDPTEVPLLLPLTNNYSLKCFRYTLLNHQGYRNECHRHTSSETDIVLLQ